MTKKILSVLFMMLAIIITPFAGINVSASGAAFDTVMVLDISGSMSEDIEDMKTSAITFCSDILNSNANNKIAVVAFETDAYTVCELTNDYNALSTAISLLTTTGGTNMTAGCMAAYDIITGPSSTNSVKNVIIMADGRPGTGASLENGRYDSMYPSLYSVSYENAVYDYVTKNLHPIASVYTVGFFGVEDPSQPTLYSEDVQLSIQLMKDISNATSFFPTDANSMFDGVADNMINNNGTEATSGTSTGVVVACVAGSGCGIGVISLIVFLATRKPPVPPAPIVSPILPLVIDDDDDEEDNKSYTISNAPPAGIERFAADAGAVRNNGYYVVPSVSSVKVTGVSGTYRYFDFDVRDGEEIRIGRDPEFSSLVITEDNTKVSRVHCTIVYNAAQGNFTVTDLSKNGTFTKKVKLPYNVPTNVAFGSEIQLADSCNIFRLG